MDIEINYQNSSQEELDKLLTENIQAGNIKIVDLLLKNGANIETKKTILSFPPLSLAVNLKEENTAFAMADFLIKKGADIHGVGLNQLNALHHAAACGYIKVTELLIQNGADVHKVDNAGETALHFAARRYYIEVIELLIQNGANVRACTKRGDKPIDTLLAVAPYTDWTTLSDEGEIAICKRKHHTVYRLFSELTIPELEAYRLRNGKEYLVDFNEAKLNNRKSMAKEIPLHLNKLLLLKQLLPIELASMIVQLDLLLKLKEVLPAWYHHRIEKDYKLICEDRLTQQKNPEGNIIFEKSVQQSPTVLFSSDTSGHKRKAENDPEENQ